MTNPNQLPSSEAPTLGDILQLQATIEALPEGGLIRDINDSERIAVNRYPDGYVHSLVTQISHISLSQRVGDTDRYATAMNYMVLRDGDETTTRLIKRPPFNVPSFEETFQGRDPRSAEGVAALMVAVTRLKGDSALYETAEQMGMYDLTAEEVRNLSQTIVQAYSPKN
ncbi:MAG: hypothetical protein M3Q70_00170 [bacterium]|nr:hypothetical protein [bacterium]